MWRWEEGAKAARATEIEYWVPATAGYDSTAWGSPNPQKFIPTAFQFKEHVSDAKAFARNNADVTGSKVVLYAWNEYGEGGIIEPMGKGMLHDGDEIVRALARS